jgi:hypothetical protein
MTEIKEHEGDAKETTPLSEEDQVIRRKELFIRFLRTWQKALPLAGGTIFTAYVVLHGSFALSSYTGREKATGVILVGMFSYSKS